MDDRLFEPEIETMPRDKIAERQQARVIEVVRLAYENSPMYRWWWARHNVRPDEIKSLADFTEKIPFISKDVIRKWRDEHGDPFGGLFTGARQRVSAVTSSSGTTGEPTFFAEYHEPFGNLAMGLARPLWGHGLRPGDYALDQPTTFRGLTHHTMRLIGVTTVEIDTFIGSWRSVLQAIERYDIRYMQLIGPLMAELERLSEHCDMRAALAPLKFAGFAGEPIGSRLRARVRDEWNVKLVMWTSVGDIGTAWQCTEGDGYHVGEDGAFVECCDPISGAAVPDGSIGELVVTAIDDELAPLIRFRSDDLVRLDRTVCDCSRTHLRMWPVGRKGDRIVVRGRTVVPHDVWEVIEQCDETRAALFQIIRPTEELDELRVRVGYDTSRTASLAELRQRLMSCIEESVGVRPVLEMVDEQAIIARASSAVKIPRVSKK
ncbi:phenylacetate--CoA ligase family protein [[Mycobacterium] vasticus]|uniref:Phenylacetate--CoA ligase family protein n=1 Tax=[Mycobacterium] vasticus TaxID=2875777 RepID=A0ABU5Z3H0_9MYCO|nr:phenylacetate--CoA ligase family protein [Mycolicibacter sp. MYC017]MEB3071690.1 phenylacetate--CoA ligase family protein [Mycolicibacter sp. MYC017]